MNEKTNDHGYGVCVEKSMVAEAQKKEFRGSDSSSSNDELQIFKEESAERKSTISEEDE